MGKTPLASGYILIPCMLPSGSLNQKCALSHKEIVNVSFVRPFRSSVDRADSLEEEDCKRIFGHSELWTFRLDNVEHQRCGGNPRICAFMICSTAKDEPRESGLA